MRPFAFHDSDAPIGASRLENRVSEPPLARPPGSVWKPFAGAAAIALVAAGMATLVVQSLGPTAPADAALDRPAPEKVASVAPQEAPAPAEASPSPVAAPEAAASAAAAPVPPAQPPTVVASGPVAQPANPPPAAVSPAPAQVASLAPAPDLSPAPQQAAPLPAAAAAAPDPAPTASQPAQPTQPTQPTSETGRRTLSSEEVLTSLERGEAKLKAGDVAAARRYFERAALAGDARGATAMGRTFDPEVLAKLPVIGLEPDPAQAASWYAKARTLKAGP